MNESTLKEFYEQAILPQFNIQPTDIIWGEHKKLGPDEDAFYFEQNKKSYALIWEDYEGSGSSPEFITETLGLTSDQFDFVLPIPDEHSPSIRIRFGYQYSFVQYITGSFTLLCLK